MWEAAQPEEYAIYSKFMYDTWEDCMSTTDGVTNTANILKKMEEALKVGAIVYSYEDVPSKNKPTRGNVSGGCNVAWFKKHYLDETSNEYNNGYNDWYIPAKDELAEFIKPVGDKRLYEILNESIEKQDGVPFNSFWVDASGAFNSVAYASSTQAEKDDEDKYEMWKISIYYLYCKPTKGNPTIANTLRTERRDRTSSLIRPIRQF